MSKPEPILVTGVPSAPPRPRDAHKGTFGRALVIAGSEGMSGAACLAGQAALHSGAGLVTVAIPNCISNIVAGAHPAYMTVPLADESGCISQEARSAIDHAITGKSAVAIGPGLGRSEQVTQIVNHLIDSLDLPMVVDADALNAFSQRAASPTCSAKTKRPNGAPRIFTPHLGEFARLTQLSVEDLKADGRQSAVSYAKEHQVILLLKGPQTLVTDGRKIAVNDTGGSSLATAGTGDILTGLIVGLLAQGMDAFEATRLGAHLHGLAGDKASEKHSDRFTTAVEILAHLDDAWLTLESRS